MQSGVRKFGRFLKDAGVLVASSTVAAFLSFAVGIWEHFHDKPLPGYTCLLLSVVLFCNGAYQAWSKNDSALTKKDADLAALIADRAKPEVVLTCNWPSVGTSENKLGSVATAARR
jgi:hypothetical protein